MAPCRVLVLLVCFGAGAVWAQEADPAKLTLDRIFASDDFRSEFGRSFRWIDAKSHLETEPSAKFKGSSDIFQVDIATKKKTLLIPAEKSAVVKAALLPKKHYEFKISSSRKTWI